ncbi:MAG TPA: carboxyltransferase domain-containing protein, partial [Candidatus Acidoferrum sp.]
MLTSAAEGARFQRASDQSLLIYFGHQITLDAHHRIRKLLRLLEIEPIAGVRNLHPAYCSVLVKFDPLKWRYEELAEILARYIGRLADVSLPEPRQVEIPVCYGGEHGPDLIEVASMLGITPERVI